MGDGYDTVITGEGSDTVKIAPEVMGNLGEIGFKSYTIGEDHLEVRNDLTLLQVNHEGDAVELLLDADNDGKADVLTTLFQIRELHSV